MEALKEQEKKFWLEFIELYKSQPVLWNPKIEGYKTRCPQTKKAYNILLDKMRELSENANIDTVKKKLNILKTCYRRELTKQRANPSYQPLWWLYPAMKFLDNQDVMEVSWDEMIANEEDLVIEQPEQKHQQQNFVIQDINTLPYVVINGANSPSVPLNLLQPDCQTPLTHSNGSFNTKNTRKRPYPNSQLTEESLEDYYEESEANFDYMAKVWAYKLRRISCHQRLFAEKAINDILFEAELGLLTRDSVKINENMEEIVVKEDEVDFSDLQTSTSSEPSH